MVKKKAVKKPRYPDPLYLITLAPEKETSNFYPEHSIIVKTVDAVNNFYFLYKVGRIGTSGPSTHDEQDLYRAMLIFACAGLDVLVKQLTKTKLPHLMSRDVKVKEKFKEYVKRGIRKDERELLNALALALVDERPRDFLAREYIESLTGESLQSVEELRKVGEGTQTPEFEFQKNRKLPAFSGPFFVCDVSRGLHRASGTLGIS